MSHRSAESALQREIAIGNRLDELENRAVWLDAEFRVPGTDFRVGISPIVGVLPGAGDSVMMLLAATIVYHGMRLGAPTKTLVWMSLVLLVEGVIGVIPVLGDAVSFVWSANIQNVGYLRANREALDGSTNWVFVLLLSSPGLLFVLAIGAIV